MLRRKGCSFLVIDEVMFARVLCLRQASRLGMLTWLEPLSCVPMTTMSYLSRPSGQPARPSSSSGSSVGILLAILKVTALILRGLGGDCPNRWGMCM